MSEMEYLIAVDLEGIHGVVGEPNCTLTSSADYGKAVEGAQLEVNAAAQALFDSGAEKVAVWDNHGGGKNLDFTQIDSRVEKIVPDRTKLRFDFVEEHRFAGILYLGYHAKEGTPNGVLAHTFNSTGIQYAKVDGKAVGELAIDTWICRGHSIPPLFLASDDVCVAEMKQICPEITTVVTKFGKGRNRAELRERECVLQEIYDQVRAAVQKQGKNETEDFPERAHLEVRYTRAERAEEVYRCTKESGLVPVEYGEDTHVLHFEVTAANQIPNLL